MSVQKFKRYQMFISDEEQSQIDAVHIIILKNFVM
jgi:hypothetical protein